MIYSFISYIRLKQKVFTAMLLQGNIFECENIATPFVLGVIKPKICLPIGLGETEQGYIIKHEKTHIRRLDHLIKPISFMVLSFHWFNPLVWLSFILMSQDLEMSCDERVIRELGQEIKQDYSTSLLNLAVNRKMVNGCPLAFGGTGAGGRIRNVLNYRRPALWVIVVAIVAVAVIGVGLLSNPDVVASNDMEKYELAETWAEALKLRDGKLRVEIMSEAMQEKFIAEQIRRSGEEWNYNIGGSSPWVVDYDIKVDGDKATIIYHLADSGGDKYDLTEVLTFGTENNRLVVIAAKEKIAEWDRVSYYAPDAQSAMEAYTKALLENDYLAILGLTHDAPFDPDGQDIWDTIKIAGVKVIAEDVRENKACYELELDIKDGGSSAFEKGIFPRWLWLVKGEHGWYVEGLMTGGTPDKDWWDSATSPINEISIKDLTEKIIITSDRYEQTEYPLLVAIPQEQIYLYGLKPTGVVLKYEDKIQIFDWRYTTPRFILPVLKKADIDNDGKDEIICVLNVDSGTGVSIDELHVLKPDGKAGFIDYLFSDYLEQVKPILSFTYNKNKNNITLKTGSHSYTQIIPAEYQEYTFKNIVYGDIVNFDIANGLKISMPLATIFNEIASPQFFEDASFNGDIVFKNGEFQIKNSRIIINK